MDLLRPLAVVFEHAEVAVDPAQVAAAEPGNVLRVEEVALTNDEVIA